MCDSDSQVKCIKCASHIRRRSKIDCFEILLEGEDAGHGGYYLPGDTVRGTVYLNTNERMKIKGVTIKCEGQCSVFWEDFKMLTYCDDVYRCTPRGYMIYDADELYMGDTQTLLAPGEDRKLMVLEAGSYEFPFKFELPEDIPGSFAHKNGVVDYKLCCAINKRWGKKDLESRRLIVGHHGALDCVPGAKCPVTVDKSKTLCCFCWKSDPISATLRLDRGGYTPGDDVIVDAEIENLSNRSIKTVTVRIIEMLQFCTWGDHLKHEEIILDEVTHDPVSSSPPCSLEGVKLHIPEHTNLPASSFPGCNLINAGYYVELDINVANMPSFLKLQAPFVLGMEPVTT